MNKENFVKYRVGLVFLLISLGVCILGGGCNTTSGYSNDSLFPTEITSVYVEMFDNQTFRRGIEYELTDALAKRIEAITPYKVVSSRDRCDTVLSGHISTISESVLSTERETGRALERGVEIQAVVTWKNLKTGQLLVNSESVSASASYSQWQNQGFRYGSAIAANNLARRIVELMEKKW